MSQLNQIKPWLLFENVWYMSIYFLLSQISVSFSPGLTVCVFQVSSTAGCWLRETHRGHGRPSGHCSSVRRSSDQQNLPWAVPPWAGQGLCESDRLCDRMSISKWCCSAWCSLWPAAPCLCFQIEADECKMRQEINYAIRNIHGVRYGRVTVLWT